MEVGFARVDFRLRHYRLIISVIDYSYVLPFHLPEAQVLKNILRLPYITLNYWQPSRVVSGKSVTRGAKRWLGVAASRRPAHRHSTRRDATPAAVVASASPSLLRDVALVIAGSGTELEDHWLARREGVSGGCQRRQRGQGLQSCRARGPGVGGVQRTLSPRLESTEHGVVFESWRHPTP